MARSTYSIPQRVLHWCVTLLVFFNLLFPDGMNAWNGVIGCGEVPTSEEVASANIHAYVGVAILLFTVMRLLLRLKSGVPPEPDGQPAIFHNLAKLAHVLLYALIFLMPVTGIAAYYFGAETLGTLHADVLKVVLWVVICAHAAGALVQHFYFRTNVLRRMTIGE